MSTGTGTEAQGLRILRTQWVWLTERPDLVAATLALLPCLYALGCEAWWGSLRPWPQGDEAVLEFHVYSAVRGAHLLGPYSQYEWYHPGPLYYYLLAPLYLLWGEATRSLYLTAAFVNVAAVTGLLYLFFKHEKVIRHRIAFCVVVAACIAGLLYQVPVGALVASPLTEIWNPVVTVLPFGLLIGCAAAVAIGGLGYMPPLALLHAFVCQSHVSYLIPASIVCAVSCLLGINRRWPDRTSARAALWVSVSLSCVFILWMPPLIAWAEGHPGNIGDLLRFVGAERRPRVPFGDSIAYAFRQLHAPALAQLVVSDGARTVLSVLFSILQIVGISFCLRKSARSDHPYLAAIAAILGILMTVALLQATQLLSLDERVFYYQTLWYGFVGTLAWTAIFFPVARGVAGRFATFKGPLVACACAVVAAEALTSIQRVSNGFERLSSREALRHWPAELVVPAAKAAVARPMKGKTPALDAGPGAWGLLAGTLVQLSKKGAVPLVSEKWRFMFGRGVEYAPESTPTVEISTRGSHAAPVLRAMGDVSLHLRGIEQPLTGNVVGVSGHEVRGDPARTIHGSPPIEGKPWDAEGAVILSNENASLTYYLPLLLVRSVEIVADGNDDYLIEASSDGSTFSRSGGVPPVPGWGLRRRTARLDAEGPWRALRIRPGHGDGSFSIASARFNDTRFACRVLDAAETEGSPRLACDGEVARVGEPWDGPSAIKFRGPGSHLTVELPTPSAGGGFVEGVRIQADGNDAYALEASSDGKTFSRLSVSNPIPRFGIQWRSFYFNDGRNWRALRLVPLSGDGSYSVAEVQPIVSQGLLLEFAAAETLPMLRDGWSGPEGGDGESWVWALGLSASLSVPLMEGRKYDLWVQLRPADIPGKQQSVAIDFNHRNVGEFLLTPNRTQAVSVSLPGQFVRARNDVRFVFRTTRQQEEGDTRALAARLYAALFRPTAM